MFHFLGFLFIIIIAILLIGLSVIGTIVRSIFGLGKLHSSSYGTGRQQPFNTSSKDETAEAEEGEIHIKRKKLFSKDEGEYVDFEEVKE